MASGNARRNERSLRHALLSDHSCSPNVMMPHGPTTSPGLASLLITFRTVIAWSQRRGDLGELAGDPARPVAFAPPVAFHQPGRRLPRLVRKVNDFTSGADGVVRRAAQGYNPTSDARHRRCLVAPTFAEHRWRPWNPGDAEKPARRRHLWSESVAFRRTRLRTVLGRHSILPAAYGKALQMSTVHATGANGQDMPASARAPRPGARLSNHYGSARNADNDRCPTHRRVGSCCARRSTGRPLSLTKDVAA